MSSQITIPNWLDEKFVERALAESEGNKIKVKRIHVRAATSPGDNYSSTIFRVSAEYDAENGCSVVNNTKCLIVKTDVSDENIEKLTAESDIFSREAKVLQRIIPAFHHLFDTVPSDKPVTLGPRCYYFANMPQKMIVMEDLCQYGFKMAARVPGLDLNHSRLVVSRIGMFHAASVALRSQEPGIFDNFLNPFHVRNADSLRNFLTHSLNALAEKVQMWSDNGQRYSDKLRNLGTTAMQRLLKTVEIDEKGFSVFTHGDAWTNNMMFSYNENGEVSDMIFLDFQCSCHGSPALDLLYFLYTSPTPEVRSRHMEELVKCYHSSLSKDLVRLGCGRQCPTLDELHTEMKKRNFMIMFAFLCVKPIISASPDCIPDLGTLVQDSSLTGSNSYLTEDYNKELQTFLPIFEKEGIFD